MSKYGSVLCASVVMMFFVVPESVFAIEAVWRVSNLENSSFPKSYTFNGCYVAPRADGDGVIVEAHDNDWNGGTGTLEQTIIVTRNQFGGARVEEYYAVHHVINNMIFFEMRSGGYDIFWAKCLDAARKLPKEVRAAFLGYYGL